MQNDADLGQHLRTVSGSFRSVRATAWSLAFVFAAIFLLLGFGDEEWSVLIGRLPGLVLIWLVAILVIRWVVHLMRVSVFTGGLAGRSFWGVRRRISWKDIADFRYDNSGGLANMVIVGNDGKEIWMLAEIGEREEFQQAVAPYFDWRGFLARDDGYRED